MSSRYVVTRQNWKRLASGFVRLPGAVDVAAFDTFADAAADRDKREAAARASVNPFAWGDSFFDVTRLAPHALCDWLQEAGLSTPPTDAPRDLWSKWWESAKSGMTGEQLARVWGVFDPLRLFDVEERPRGATVHTLVMIPWRQLHGDSTRYASYEGGAPRAAYRTPAAAAVAGKGYAADYEASENVDGDEYEYVPNMYMRYDVGDRTAYHTDPLVPPHGREDVRTGNDPRGVPRFDVVPMDVVGDPGAVRLQRSVFAVVRLAWTRNPFDAYKRIDHPDAFIGWRPLPDEEVLGLPVAAFANRGEAEADAWDRDVAARKYLNPFRFGPPAELTRLNEVAYRAMLADLGLDLPSGVWTDYFPLQLAWAAWWEHAACLLADDQRETVWDLLDQLRFHRVVELELRG